MTLKPRRIMYPWWCSQGSACAQYISFWWGLWTYCDVQNSPPHPGLSTASSYQNLDIHRRMYCICISIQRFARSTSMGRHWASSLWCSSSSSLPTSTLATFGCRSPSTLPPPLSMLVQDVRHGPLWVYKDYEARNICVRTQSYEFVCNYMLSPHETDLSWCFRAWCW